MDTQLKETQIDATSWPTEVLEQLKISCESRINDLIGIIALWQTNIDLALKGKETSLDILRQWGEMRDKKQAELDKVISAKAYVMAIMTIKKGS